MQNIPEAIEQQFNELYCYWSSLRVADAIPKRSDFRPEKIPRLLPNLSLDEYQSNEQIIARLRGSNVINRVGFDLTGKNAVTAYADESRDALIEAARRVVETPCGGRTHWYVESVRGKITGVFGLYLPLVGNQQEKLLLSLSIDTTDQNWAAHENHAAIAITPKMEFIDLGFGIDG